MNRPPDTPRPIDTTAVVASGTAFESIDPATGSVVAEVPASTGADVGDAVAHAVHAAATTHWPSDAALRSRVLLDLAVEIRSHHDVLVELLAREVGKPVAEAGHEVAATADMFEYYGGVARTLQGRSSMHGDRVQSVVLREPVGVVAVISPWNWPLVMTARALAPALAAGNCCVLKPSELTPAVVSELIGLLCRHAAIPDGVVSIVHGDGTVGATLVADRRVDMISFTGGTTTGEHIMRGAADGVRKVALELGGSSPFVVFADADIDKTVAGAASALYQTAGQICTAGSRVLVESSIADEFVERLAAVAAGLRVGDPFDADTTMGPLASAQQRDRVAGFVDTARSAGATVVAGGHPLEGGAHDAGYFYAPTLVADLPAGSSVGCTELFGPVGTIRTFTDDDEAIGLANDTTFGLAAGVWTSNLHRAWRMSRAIDAGTVWVNTYNRFYAETAGAGFKGSGIGESLGASGAEEFTRLKHVNFDGNPTMW